MSLAVRDGRERTGAGSTGAGVAPPRRHPTTVGAGGFFGSAVIEGYVPPAGAEEPTFEVAFGAWHRQLGR